jgi:integral membrane protein
MTFAPFPVREFYFLTYKRTFSMYKFLSTALGRLRLIAFVEGVSFLILLFIAMPLKYFFEQPQAVRAVGSVHGALFVGYILLLFLAKRAYSWNNAKTRLLLLISLVPFGNFYADKKWLAPENQ